MAYVPGGLSVKTDTLSHGGPREWILQGSDAVTTVRGANYISDAEARGMRAGDLVYYIQWTTFTDQYTFTAPIVAYQLMPVLTVASTGADLGDGTAIDITNT